MNDDNLNKCACTLIIQTLNHPNPMLRCAAAEAFGCLIQVLPDKRLIENIIRFCFDHLKESRDIPSRTGYSLALVCSYCYLDNMAKGQYLSLSIRISSVFDASRRTEQCSTIFFHFRNLAV